MPHSRTAVAMMGLGLMIGAIAAPVLGQLDKQIANVPRAGWVELRDTAKNLRGYLQFINDGSRTEVIFRDADGKPIEIKRSQSGGELPPLKLKPLPDDEKADAGADIALLRNQIRTLDKNVTDLKNAVYGRR